MTAGGRGQGGNDRIDAVETTMEERRALDRELREELTKILTPEQAKIAIPQRGEGREGGRGGRNRDNIPM
jgi:Spy/CpxP family protein refolding chaperone